MTRTFGIDFSADQNRAGRKAWIAELGGDGDTPRLVRCDTLCGWTGGPATRSEAHAALVDWVAQLGPCVIGCDFPFGLPAVHLPPEANWVQWLKTFDPDPDPSQPLVFWREAQQQVQRATGGTRRELRRTTDTLTKTPMAPLNRRVFFQTFFGVRDVLRPLVAQGGATVAPMMPAHPGKPTLIEVCPGSWLKQHPTLDAQGYKGSTGNAKRGRDAIVRWLRREAGVDMPERLARQLRQDPEADAIDAALSAWCAWRHRDRLQEIPAAHRDDALREGWVYV